jgi:RNA polymerase sigma factor (sigma-70 family)
VPTDPPSNPVRTEATVGSPSPSDAALLESYAREADEAAFAEVVRRHLDLVHSAALRQAAGDRHQAEDVVQAVFTALARQAGPLRSHPALAGWLVTATRRMARTVQRGERRRRQREHVAMLMDSPATGSASAVPPAPEADWSALAPVLDDALHELDERDRTAVVLRFFQSQPFAEIGAALGLSANTARMRVDRALDRLQRRLVRRGIDSTSAALAAALTAHAVHAAPAALSASVAAAALAAATGTGLTTTAVLIPIMTSLKSKLLVGAVAATLMAAPLAWQHHQLVRLRTALAEATLAQETLAQSEAAARQSAAADATELERLRGLRTEVMRLRGELGPLREQLRAKATSVATRMAATPQAAATERSTATEPGNGEPQDLGSATAEHAAGSLIWAVSQGRVDRLAELLELPPAVAPDDAPRHLAFFSSQLSNVFAGKDFNAWSMDLRGTTNEDVVRLHYGYRDRAADTLDTFVFVLRRLESGWKVRVEGEVPEDF